jgi:hypothetical protein
VQWCFLDIGQIDRNLSRAVFLHVPTDRFDVLQHSRHPDLLALFIQDWFASWSAVLGLYSTVLPNIERN